MDKYNSDDSWADFWKKEDIFVELFIRRREEFCLSEFGVFYIYFFEDIERILLF